MVQVHKLMCKLALLALSLLFLVQICFVCHRYVNTHRHKHQQRKGKQIRNWLQSAHCCASHPLPFNRFILSYGRLLLISILLSFSWGFLKLVVSLAQVWASCWPFKSK